MLVKRSVLRAAEEHLEDQMTCLGIRWKLKAVSQAFYLEDVHGFSNDQFHHFHLMEI